jgi:hypothetical protein
LLHSRFPANDAMRTTIDLPDDLLKQAKIFAVQRGSSLRDLVAAGLRAEMARADSLAPARPALPALTLPADAPLLRMSAADISAALAAEEALDDAARLG